MYCSGGVGPYGPRKANPSEGTAACRTGRSNRRADRRTSEFAAHHGTCEQVVVLRLVGQGVQVHPAGAVAWECKPETAPEGRLESQLELGCLLPSSSPGSSPGVSASAVPEATSGIRWYKCTCTLAAPGTIRRGTPLAGLSHRCS